jgi:hypothetical protein
MWNRIFFHHPDREHLASVVLNGIHVPDHFTHFTGVHKGVSYNANTPPSFFGQNNISCSNHTDFIFQQLYDKSAFRRCPVSRPI